MPPSPISRERLKLSKLGVVVGAALTFGVFLGETLLAVIATMVRSAEQAGKYSWASELLYAGTAVWLVAVSVYAGYHMGKPRGRMGCLFYFLLLPVLMFPGTLLDWVNFGFLIVVVVLNILCLWELNSLDRQIEAAPIFVPAPRPVAPRPEPMEEVEVPPDWDEGQSKSPGKPPTGRQ